MIAQAITQGERSFAMRKVICIYHDEKADPDNAYAATVHDVKVEDKRPVIQPGVPITVAAIEHLAIALGRRIEAAILPTNVLSITISQIVWWHPAVRARIWFNPDPAVKEKSELKKLNGKFVIHPALLFVAGNGLRAYALNCDSRPQASTPLYVAPYYNLSSDSGSMCNGNVTMPRLIGPDAIPAYEKAFYGSAFSHSNWGHLLTIHHKGHLGFWQEMAEAAARKRLPMDAPSKYLVKSKQTVGSVIRNQRLPAPDLDLLEPEEE